MGGTNNMKPRLYPYLDLLLIFGLLAGGFYAYKHPAVARRWLDAVTLSTEADPKSGPNWVERLNAPVQVVEKTPATWTPPAPVASSQSWGTRIAAGHAFAKHGREMGFSTRDEMAAFIDRVIASPSASRSLSRGRQAYWDDGSGTVVICDPATADGGTAFKPDRGRRYFEDLR
jgi:filamentous hemagglutinin